MPAEGLRHLELAAKLTSGAVWLSVGTRADVQGTAWAAHAHWLLGHDAEALSACHGAIKLARAIDHPYCLAVALAYGSITHQMRHDLPELRDTVGELRELCDRYGFAYYREWGLILDGWSRPDESGIDLARRGIGNLKTAGSFARMPYWLSLLADLLARNDQARRRTSDPGRRPRRRKATGRPVVAARGNADARRLRRGGGGHLAPALRRGDGDRPRQRRRCSGAASVISRERGVRPLPMRPAFSAGGWSLSAHARTLRERCGS